MSSHATALASPRTQTIGRAYAFFTSLHEPERLRHTLNKMKASSDSNVPKEMRFFLHNIRDLQYKSVVVNHRERHLYQVGDMWYKKGANSFMRTLLPSATNEDAALAAGRIVELMHSQKLIDGNGRPDGEVYFVDKQGKFVAKVEAERVQRLKQQAMAQLDEPTPSLQLAWGT